MKRRDCLPPSFTNRRQTASVDRPGLDPTTCIWAAAFVCQGLVPDWFRQVFFPLLMGCGFAGFLVFKLGIFKSHLFILKTVTRRQSETERERESKVQVYSRQKPGSLNLHPGGPWKWLGHLLQKATSKAEGVGLTSALSEGPRAPHTVPRCACTARLRCLLMSVLPRAQVAWPLSAWLGFALECR